MPVFYKTSGRRFEGLTLSQVRSVTKTYESKGRTYRALDDISLDIEVET